MKTKFTSQTRRTLPKNAILFAITALALCACWPVVALADDCSNTTKWRGTTGSWFVDGNWDNHVPGSTTAAQINNGGTAQISADAPMAEACSLTLGANPGDSGTVQVSPPHGDLSIGEAIFVGEGGKGNLTQTFGTIASASGSIASASGSNGSVTVDGTSSSWRVSGEVDVGGTTTVAGGTGLLTVTNGGSVTAASIHAWKSGTLTGNGIVSTTNGTTIDGTLAPSGTLTVGSNLSFGTLGGMRCNVTSSSWDRVEVSGRATLDGKLAVTLTGFFTGDFPLLHASTLVGTFSSYSFTYTGCLAPSIVYDYTNGYVYLHVEATCQ
jgi:T5SS/PEP-CTERM-associated repeat protein